MAKRGTVHEHVLLEIRFGTGGRDGRKGDKVGLRRYVDPSVAEWYRGLESTDTDPELGGCYIYIGDVLATDVPAFGAAPPPAELRPLDPARLESMRVEEARLVSRQQQLAGQVQADERRLAAVQSELTTLELRVRDERERVTREIRLLDEQLAAHMTICADARRQETDSLKSYRDAMAEQRRMSAELAAEAHKTAKDMVETEGDVARYAMKRKLEISEQITEVLEAFKGHETAALLKSLSDGKGPGALAAFKDTGAIEGLLGLLTRIVNSKFPETH